MLPLQEHVEVLQTRYAYFEYFKDLDAIKVLDHYSASLEKDINLKESKLRKENFMAYLKFKQSKLVYAA